MVKKTLLLISLVAYTILTLFASILNWNMYAKWFFIVVIVMYILNTYVIVKTRSEIDKPVFYGKRTFNLYPNRPNTLNIYDYPHVSERKLLEIARWNSNCGIYTLKKSPFKVTLIDPIWLSDLIPTARFWNEIETLNVDLSNFWDKIEHPGYPRYFYSYEMNMENLFCFLTIVQLQRFSNSKKKGDKN